MTIEPNLSFAQITDADKFIHDGRSTVMGKVWKCCLSVAPRLWQFAAVHVEENGCVCSGRDGVVLALLGIPARLSSCRCVIRLTGIKQ